MGEKQKLKVKYEKTTAEYASQFLVNITAEEVYLDLSSGPVTDPATGTSVVPIHTRIAMSHAGARRLSQILDMALRRKESAAAVATHPAAAKSAARLPKVDN